MVQMNGFASRSFSGVCPTRAALIIEQDAIVDYRWRTGRLTTVRVTREGGNHGLLHQLRIGKG